MQKCKVYEITAKFGKNWDPQITKIALSRTISEINAFLCFTQKFKIAAENGEKTIFGKSQMILRSSYPRGQKFRKKSLYPAPFLR